MPIAEYMPRPERPLSGEYLSGRGTLNPPNEQTDKKKKNPVR
jgi:hypothetical protein